MFHVFFGSPPTLPTPSLEGRSEKIAAVQFSLASYKYRHISQETVRGTNLQNIFFFFFLMSSPPFFLMLGNFCAKKESKIEWGRFFENGL